jgi:hypothetical protein
LIADQPAPLKLNAWYQARYCFNSPVRIHPPSPVRLTRIFTFLSIIIGMLTAGCVSYKALDGVKSLAISPEISKTGGMISPASANIPDLGDVAINQIVDDAFTSEIKGGGQPFVLAQPGAADATMHLKILDYGLVDKRGGVGPFVTVKATMISRDGNVIYRSPDVYLTAPRASWRSIQDYTSSPAILRQGLRDAAGEAAHAVFADLGDLMEGDTDDTGVSDTRTEYLHR